MNGPSVSLINLDFSLSDFLLLLESCDDSSAAGGDELPSFSLDHCSNILCALVIEFGSSKPNIGLRFGK